MLEKEQRRREQVVIRDEETEESVLKRLIFLKSQEVQGLCLIPSEEENSSL